MKKLNFVLSCAFLLPLYLSIAYGMAPEQMLVQDLLALESNFTKAVTLSQPELKTLGSENLNPEIELIDSHKGSDLTTLILHGLCSEGKEASRIFIKNCLSDISGSKVIFTLPYASDKAYSSLGGKIDILTTLLTLKKIYPFFNKIAVIGISMGGGTLLNTLKTICRDGKPFEKELADLDITQDDLKNIENKLAAVTFCIPMQSVGIAAKQIAKNIRQGVMKSTTDAAKRSVEQNKNSSLVGIPLSVVNWTTGSMSAAVSAVSQLTKTALGVDMPQSISSISSDAVQISSDGVDSSLGISGSLAVSYTTNFRPMAEAPYQNAHIIRERFKNLPIMFLPALQDKVVGNDKTVELFNKLNSSQTHIYPVSEGHNDKVSFTEMHDPLVFLYHEYLDRDSLQPHIQNLFKKATQPSTDELNTLFDRIKNSNNTDVSTIRNDWLKEILAKHGITI